MKLLPLERRTADVLLALGVVVAGVWRDLLPGTGTTFLLSVPPPLVLLAHVVSATVLVTLRTRRPALCAVLLGIVSLAVPSYAALVVPYSLVRYGRPAWTTAACGLAALLGWVVGADLWVDGDPLSSVVVAAATAAAGAYARGRARALERVAAQDRQIALAEERRRVAAELHDSVTHWVTLVVMQSGALSVRASDPDVRSEASSIRDNGVGALRELQDMVSVLTGDETPHDPPGSPEPQEPQDPQDPVTDAVDRAVTAGQVVTAHCAGPRLAPGDPVAPIVADVVREALANARKHAPGAAVAVRLAVREHVVRLLVRDDGDRTGAPWPAAGAGTGLDSLHERVVAQGGTLSAAPTLEGGFEVDVRLPRAPRGGEEAG